LNDIGKNDKMQYMLKSIFALLPIISLSFLMTATAAQRENPRGSTETQTTRTHQNNAETNRAATSQNTTSRPASNRVAQNTNASTVSRTVSSRAATISRAPSARALTLSNSATPTRTVRSRSVLGGGVISRGAPQKTTQNVFRNRDVNSAKPNAPTNRFVAARAATTGAGFGMESYDNCKDAYFNCMDQFCDDADATYKKCVCSDKVIELRARMGAAESAVSAINNLRNERLNVVGMDADAVGAMYQSTEGENAVVKDESAAAQELDAISDTLANIGKAKTSNKKASTTLNFSLSSDFDWDSDGSLFGGVMESDAVDTVDVNLTGDALYKSVDKQCQSMLKDVCNKKNLGVIISLYKQGVNKDCTAVEKGVKKNETKVKDGISQTKQELMQARLENFENTHQGAVQCLESATTMMTNDAVCGKDYIKCLDFSGKYINYASGKAEPIYGSSFGGLKNAIEFPDSSNSSSGDNIAATSLRSVSKNQTYITKLEERKYYFEDILKSCQDYATDVWNQAIDAALLAIKQAQEAKFEEVKDNCLIKINDCRKQQANNWDTNFNEEAAAPAQSSGTSYSNGSTTTTGGTGNTATAKQAAALICQNIIDGCTATFGAIFSEADGNGIGKALGSHELKDMVETAITDDINNAKLGEACRNFLGGSWANGECTIKPEIETPTTTTTTTTTSGS
jgi:hypothetical protein